MIAHGRGIGRHLRRFAFELALDMVKRVGYFAVLVDSKPEAVGFYERLGFIDLPPVEGALGDRPQPTPMVLSLKKIRTALGSEKAQR